jgi:hypothetical protein
MRVIRSRFGRRLDQIVLGPLAQAPDAIGLHVLGADDDDRDGAGVRVACDSTRVAWNPFMPGMITSIRIEVRQLAPAGLDARFRGFEPRTPGARFARASR